MEIKKLLWFLLNSDCISFYYFLQELRYGDFSDTFSIFKFCDEVTNKLIVKLIVLAKSRIFTIIPVSPENNQGQRDRKSMLDLQYGKLIKEYSTRWTDFQNKVFDKIEHFLKFTENHQFELSFDKSPKYEAIVDILKKYE